MQFEKDERFEKMKALKVPYAKLNIALESIILPGVFFSVGVFFSEALPICRTAGEVRKPFIYSTLPLVPSHEDSDIYLQFCMSIT